MSVNVGRRPVGGRAALLGLMLALVAGPAAAQRADDTVRVRNRASLSYELASGERAETFAEADVIVQLLPRLRLVKHVDRTVATRGDTLTYTLAVTNDGRAASGTLQLVDTLPPGVHLVPNHIVLDGRRLTDAADTDALQVTRDATGRAVVTIALAPIEVEAAQTARLVAVVADSAPLGPLRNVATLRDGTTTVASAAATTQLALATLTLTKAVDGPTTVYAGSTVRYVLRVTNSSTTVAARAVALVDTLPTGLRFVSADGAPTPDDSIVRWDLGTLAPGASVTRTLTLRVGRVPASGARLINTAVVRSVAANPVTASAAALDVQPLGRAELRVRKAAGVLAAALGESVPYTVTLYNGGQAALGDVILVDELPTGMRLATAGVRGADSLRVDGQRIHLFVAGPIAPADSLVLHYAAALVAASPSGVLTNRVWGTALDGAVTSDTATASVRIQRDFPLRDRTMTGKVWVDADADGIQDPGEAGLPFARIFTERGEMIVADREGRFSLQTLEAGIHAFRLDTVGLPASVELPPGVEMVRLVRADGWTSPHVTFRVIPRAGAVACDCDAAEAPPTPLMVAPLRTDAERAADQRDALVAGPAVRIAAPRDGIVLGTDQVYVGVVGEPGAAITLYDGTTRLQATHLRPDGHADFVGVAIAPGPHILRVAMTNSWNQVRWDSIRVHGSGAPAALALADTAARPIVLHAESADPMPVRVRVLDRWGVPVATQPAVTVEAGGAAVEGMDADQSSVGAQRRVGPDGVLALALRARDTVGTGTLTLQAGSVGQTVPLTILPSRRAFTLTGMGTVGVGGAPDAAGAVAAHGAIGVGTSVTLSIDSRRHRSDDEFFANGVDPLGEATLPLMGDSSITHIAAPTSSVVAARLEHGLDWLAAGDIDTRRIGPRDPTGLLTYQRALRGVSGRLQTGPITWRAFGSATTQTLAQQQFRADGTSGPYVVGAGTRPGTEQVAIEIRAVDNAARLLSRQLLSRAADYDIDYARGLVLLRHAVPATDPYGNPVFIVITRERTHGGDRKMVGGVHADVALGQQAPADSMILGVTGIRDAGAVLAPNGAMGPAGLASGPLTLVGATFTLRRQGTRVNAAVVQGTLLDSTALAAQADLALGGDSARVRGRLSGFTVRGGLPTPVNPRLTTPVDGLDAALTLQVTPTVRTEVQQSYQRFPLVHASRRRTGLVASEQLGTRTVRQELGLVTTSQATTDSLATSGPSSTALTGKLTGTLTSRLSAWVERQHGLSADSGAVPIPEKIAMGLSYRLGQAVTLEASRQRAWLPSDTVRYTTSSVGLRATVPFGATLNGTVARTAAASPMHTLTLGWTQRLVLSPAWTVHSMFERRIGLSRAPLIDPVRALPFAQVEPDRTAAALGLAWAPAGDRGQVSTELEWHDGEARHGYRVAVAGDAPLGANAGILLRSDWALDRYRQGSQGTLLSRNDRSVLGFAFRPASTDALNALLKLEWRRTENPLRAPTLSIQGENERLIAIADAVWTVSAATEIGARYALRWTAPDAATATLPAVSTRAHFVGVRGEHRIWHSLRARLDGRLLHEATSATTVWGLTPSLALGIGPRLELEAGYRGGPLVDADFAGVGTPGAFLTASVRLTEDVIHHPLDFWRARVRTTR